MKKMVFTILFSLVISFAVNAQNDSNQIKRLKKELAISNSTPIIVNKNKLFPEGNVIKIFVSIKHNKKFAKNFSKWVNEWNRENAKQDGTLQIVDKLQDADIAAVQFKHRTRSYVREDSVSITTSGNVNNNDDDIFGQSVGNSKVRANRGYRRLKFPLFSYLMVRGFDNSWIVNFSYVDETLAKNRTLPEQRLRNKIRSKMKKR